MNLSNLKPLIKLSLAEENAFASHIKEKRKSLIKSPKDAAAVATQRCSGDIDALLANGRVSDAIVTLRQEAYDVFLEDESIFNGVILSDIGLKFDTPKINLELASKTLFNGTHNSFEDFNALVSAVFGKYAGSVSPYIYQLCLSNTQSRRSRAGKVFEGIIYFLYEYFGFPYESQSTIGRQSFTDLGLGKVVDSILPSTQAFKTFRKQTIVGSMKTTLRERWQEVVEEIQRSTLPNIYLLTVDTDISENKIDQMNQHNIVLVVLQSVKSQSWVFGKHNVIDFEAYFGHDIPSVLQYWNKESPC